ncbi:MAG: hypothetical protein HY270_23700 [Deltaproteobacteria bacterium]|nr:hypothetical protein [Deltaproteobacteria bacterium]
MDGFAAPWWVGGLEELVESAAGFCDLDLDILNAYLKLLDRRVLDAATGWFLERYPEVSGDAAKLLAQLEKRRPQKPVYLGGRRAGGPPATTLEDPRPSVAGKQFIRRKHLIQ